MTYRYFKGNRDCGGCLRGTFSYFTESVINLLNLYENHKNEKIIYYHDLSKIKNLGTSNIFDVCFKQDTEDFLLNKNNYLNIENTNHVYHINPYGDGSDLTHDLRDKTENIINEHFILHDHLKEKLNVIQTNIRFENTIGIHRRNTDIVGHNSVVPLDSLFEKIDSYNYDKILLLCDNETEYNFFISRYGEKIISFDTHISKNDHFPFFRSEPNHPEINEHIIELVFGALSFGKCDKFICGKSNLSYFSILSNKHLNFEIL